MSDNNWPTKDEDIETAEHIISKHLDFNDGEPLGLFEVIIGNGEKVNLQIADWLIEISEHFSTQYGHEQGEVITQQIVSHCLKEGETIH